MRYWRRLCQILALSLTCSAWAFDISPEYQGLNEQALTRFEAPEDVDSEYQLIWDAYLPPLSWARAWSQNSREFNYTAGSLSNTQFLIYSQAKFSSALTDSLTFRFTYFTQRDRENDQTRHVLELEQKIVSGIKIALYGEPSMFKRENDIGAALIFTPQSNFANRIYFTRHDFTRNDHNNLSDRFTKGRESDSFGWIGIWNSENLWIRGGFRDDQPVEWIRPQESRVFRYAKRLVFSDLEWMMAADRRLNLRAQWDETFKEESPDTPSSTVTLKSCRLDRRWARAAYIYGADDATTVYEAALSYVTREWRNQNDQVVLQRNFLPGLSVRFHQVRLGVEANSFAKKDLSGLTSDEQLDGPLELRGHASYLFSFKNNASLTLALNFDLDDWRTVPAFEGGSGQFRTEF